MALLIDDKIKEALKMGDGFRIKSVSRQKVLDCSSNGVIYAHFANGNILPYRLNFDDIDANDWEIIREGENHVS